MKRATGIFLILLVMLAAFMSSCSKNDLITIGVLIPSTGSGSHMSETINGIKMAVDELNEWGGINERQVELIIRDNESDPAKAVEQFEELEKEFKPDLYFTSLSNISLALAPVAERYEAPLVSLVSASTEVTKDSNWVFRFYVTELNEIPPAMYFIKKNNVKEAAVIYKEGSFGEGLMEAFKSAAEDAGLGNIGSFSFKGGEIELGQYINEIKRYKAVYIVGYATDMPELLAQLRNYSYEGLIIAHSSASQTQVRNLAAAEGVRCAAPPIYNDNYTYAAELKKKFEAEFNTPLNHYGANGYEAVKIFASLVEGKEIARTETRDLLSGGFTHIGSLGKIVVKPGSHDYNFELLPAVIKDGDLKYE